MPTSSTNLPTEELELPFEKVSICERYESIFECKFEIWRTNEVVALNEEHENTNFLCDSPSMLTLAPDQHLLFIPVQSGPSPKSYAVGFVFSTHPNVFLRLAESYGNPSELEAEVNRLTAERHALLSQVSINFEELSFFRKVAPELSQRVEQRDVTLLANTVFEMIATSSRSEALILFRTCENEPGVYDEVARFGTTTASHEKIGNLLTRYVPETNEPRIVNFLDPTVFEEHEVRNFILIPVTHVGKSLGWLVALNRTAPNEMDFEGNSEVEFGSCEATILGSAATMLASYIVNIDMLNEHEQFLTNVVYTLVSTIEAKDAYTCGHSERVASYAQHLAKCVGYDEDALERVYLSGLLHDIGKIGIPDSVLHKPSLLTSDEFDLIRRHPVEGWEILRDLDELSYVKDGVLHHHENVDGSGYPSRLSGEDIPLDGRILAIADALDAMTSDRPYRDGMSFEAALKIIRGGAGKQWDCNLVKIFENSLNEFEALHKHFKQRVF